MADSVVFSDVKWIQKALAKEIIGAGEPMIQEAVQKFEASAREKLAMFAMKMAKESCVMTMRDRLVIEVRFDNSRVT